MAYCTVDSVSGMFPSFTRGGANQKPTDAQIQVWTNDVAGDIEAVLLRRFSESIAAPPFNKILSSWIAALPIGATNILEKINRYGGAAQLGITLASLGSKALKDICDKTQADYEKLLFALDGRDEKGFMLPSGPYDAYFDPLSRVSSPRPGLQAISGGNNPKGQTAETLGLRMPFSMNEVI